MDFLMCVKVTGMGEELVTGGAFDRPISCVCPLVTLLMNILREGLVTLETKIWFLSSVDSHVSPQGS